MIDCKDVEMLHSYFYTVEKFDKMSCRADVLFIYFLVWLTYKWSLILALFSGLVRLSMNKILLRHNKNSKI